jgi:outer membrane protein OmpA-like peptidoglycan-associated protein
MPTAIDRRQIIHACVGMSALVAGQSVILPQCFAAGAESDAEIESMKRALIPRTRRGGAEQLTVERQTVERLKAVRQKRGGGLNLQERDELYEATRQMPQTDLEIFFAFDSAELLPEATTRLDKLGKVLADPALQQNNIVISGHTDRKGSAEYNQGLSERRAASVVDYLVNTFGLDRNNLMAVGYGFERLKNPADPMAAENRRVQVVNGQRP